MDFKVAGTKDGITGFQMDIKISSVSTEILQKALEQAKRGRLHILSIMEKTISQPETEISPLAPQVINARIDPDKIGLVIGPAGKNIKALSEKYDVQINIDEDGSLTVYGKDQKSVFKARDEILGMVEEPEIGKFIMELINVFTDFGAFVEILPGRRRSLPYFSAFQEPMLTRSQIFSRKEIQFLSNSLTSTI